MQAPPPSKGNRSGPGSGALAYAQSQSAELERDEDRDPSVSKTLAPGLRLGWIVAPAWLAGTLAEVKFWTDIAAPVVDQVALAVFIESGALDRHIRRMSSRYAAGRDRLPAARRTAPPGLDGHRCGGWTARGPDAERPVTAPALHAAQRWVTSTSSHCPSTPTAAHRGLA